jgi:hypothetical protein
MIDIYILLSSNHPAVYSLKLVISRLPRFSFQSPLPHNHRLFPVLHQENINTMLSYFCSHQMSTSNELDQFVYRPGLFPQFNVENNSFLQPLLRLRRCLETFKLMMLPADKTRQLVILPTSTVYTEMNIQLSDNSTYQILTMEDYIKIEKLQRDTVIEAAKYYNLSYLIVPRPSKRYIYFLPKVHKPIKDWRSIFHPRMRPIVSDTGSITNRLAKHLLPHLQNIERCITTTVPSSLAVAYNIDVLNNSEMPMDIILATIDVEALFTNIPQDKLLDIVNIELIAEIPDDIPRQRYMHYLSTIIKYNTFQVQNVYYLQTIGLPMGGRLSCTLANIYLGILEKSVYNLPKIHLYNRYVDDILLITSYSEEETGKFIKDLESSFSLRLTASYNRQSVNFLDMTIYYSYFHRSFYIYPFSKNFIYFPLPSALTRRPIMEDLNIIKAQILRTWRFSTDDVYYTSTVVNYLSFLTTNSYFLTIRKHLLNFLSSLLLENGLYSTAIPLCQQCLSTIQTNNIMVKKIVIIGGKYLATREPVNCTTTNIHIILQCGRNPQLLLTLSIHQYLAMNIQNNCTIIPIGKLNMHKMQQLLEKHPSINYLHRKCVMNMKSHPPCFLHYICKKPWKIYGIHCRSRKKSICGELFNKYKKVSRI